MPSDWLTKWRASTLLTETNTYLRQLLFSDQINDLVDKDYQLTTDIDFVDKEVYDFFAVAVVSICSRKIELVDTRI